MISVYVAGKPVSRRDLPALQGIIWLEPYIYGDEIGEKDSDIYVPRDLMLLNRADIILILIETGEERNTYIEAGIAFAKGKPIITVVGPKHVGHMQLLRQISTSVFIDRSGALDALEIIGREEFEVTKQNLRHEEVINKKFELPPRR